MAAVRKAVKENKHEKQTHVYPPPNKNTIVHVYGRDVDISTTSGQIAHQILRQCEILDQCGNLANSSKNLETVMRNIPLYEKALKYLCECPDYQLKMCGLKSKQQLCEMYNSWLTKKPGIINEAIKRSCNAAIDHAKGLKTEKGQINYLHSYINKSLSLSGLFPENIQFLNHIKESMDKAK